MKKILTVSIILIVFALMLVGCSEKNITGPKTTTQGNDAPKVAPIPYVYPIWAGQNIQAGTVTVINDADYIYVTFATTGDWMLDETHVHVAANLNGIPHTKNGIPIPGQFDYSTMHYPLVTTYTYNISLDDYEFEYNDVITIAAHCSVVNGSDPDDPDYQQETGWGGDQPGPGPRWWYYIQYTLQPPDDDDPDPDPDYQAETAMIRMYDLPRDFTYNWGTHPWFSYVKSTPSATPQIYYFYAGQTYKCGEVQIWKDIPNNKLKVQINMVNNWLMEKSDLNVNLTGYSGAPSFGGFPWHGTYDPWTNADTYTIDWDPTWTDQELSISLHANAKLPIVP